MTTTQVTTTEEPRISGFFGSLRLGPEGGADMKVGTTYSLPVVTVQDVMQWFGVPAQNTLMSSKELLSPEGWNSRMKGM
jgi:hypothetical protein